MKKSSNLTEEHNAYSFFDIDFGARVVVFSIFFVSGCSDFRRSSGIFGREETCEIEDQLSFSAVGKGIVGHWLPAGGDNSGNYEIRFDSQGHVHYRYFGCEPAYWPIVEDGLNSAQAFIGYHWRLLESYEIRSGYFRLNFRSNGGGRQHLEGTLLSDNSLRLDASDEMKLTGLYFKKDKPDDEEESSTSGSDGSDDSLSGSGGSDMESSETNATGSES